MQILLHVIEQCLEKARLVKDNQRYQEHLEALVAERTRELEQTQRQILNCLGKAAEFKDSQTGSHVCRVAQMSYLIARGLGLDKTYSRVIRDAAPMHDVGKIGIHDDVLLKCGRLDADEWEQMKAHVNIGCTILCTGDSGDVDQTCFTDLLANPDQDVGLLTVAKRIALFHHERWDGNGYPLGLAAEMIPIEARIVGLVDVYDALSSKRPYKDPFPEARCQKLIEEGSGTQFDPAVVFAFFENLDGILRIKQRLAG
jgi:putative two-component system response regulator